MTGYWGSLVIQSNTRNVLRNTCGGVKISLSDVHIFPQELWII
jgi:hypothetical protein